MSQRSTSPLKRSTVRRTLQRFWDVTRTQPLIVFLSVFSSAGYIFLLTFANTYVMALIVDRVQAARGRRSSIRGLWPLHSGARAR